MGLDVNQSAGLTKLVVSTADRISHEKPLETSARQTGKLMAVFAPISISITSALAARTE